MHNECTMTERQSSQVCDRCRVKRTKCDGRRPKCTKCDRAGVDCTTSTQLRRKTTPRGYVEPTREIIQQLTDELQKARQQLRDVSDEAKELRATVSRQNEELDQMKQLHSHNSSANISHSQVPSQSKQSSSQGPVVGHLGRLVLGESNAEFFAGSTTGVHFVLSAQQQYQTLFSSTDHFPECLFRLHVLQLSDPRNRVHPSDAEHQAVEGQMLNLDDFEYDFLCCQSRARFQSAFYRFQQCLGMLYPILLSKQFFGALDQVLHEPRCSAQVPILLQIYTLLALDSYRGPESDTSDTTLTQSQYDRLLSDLFGRMPCRGNLPALQALMLYILYLQSTSQHSLALRVCGMAVRMAQSLGLHRHSRRFRHILGETELRKRLWWCVYILDVQSSVLYGLPRTIQHADMDVDLPINANFDDLHCDQLSYPLPGETTRMGPFIQYIQLSQILSRCLQQMYTTTDRRGAVGKIQRLQHELEVWKQNLQSSSSVGLEDMVEKGPGATVDYISLWLYLMEEFTSVLIHRPALTFGPQEPQFKESLNVCVQAACHIIASFEYGQDQHLLPRMWPSGYHLVFQSAMMILYSGWVGSRSSPADASPEMVQSVRVAVDLLNPGLDSQPSVNASSPDPISELRQTASFLGHLLGQSLQLQVARPDLNMNLPPDQPVDVLVPHSLNVNTPMEALCSFNQATMPHLMGSPSATWTPFSMDGMNQMEPFEFTDSFLVPWGD